MAYSGRSGSRKPGGNSGNRGKSGSKPPFKRGGSSRGDDDRPGFRKKSYGDRDDKPAFRRRSSDGDDRPAFKKKSFGDKPAFRKRSDDGDERPRKSFGDRGPKKSFGDKPAFRKRSDDGDERPRKSFGDRGPKKSFGDKPAFRKRSDDGDERPRKSFGDRGPKKSFGDKPAFRKRSDEGDDKPAFRKKSFGGSSDRPRRSFGDRGAKPSWKRGDRSENSFEKKRGGDDGEWETFDNESASEYVKKSSSKAPRSSGAKSHRGYDEDAGDGKIRLNKYIANTGLCSRREADEMIEAGAFKVNGVIVTQLGTKVGPDDKVHYGDQLLRREKMVYVLLNKPKDYITTTDDPQERKTVLDLVNGAGDERIYPVGRLDRNTTGVLLLTNDGDLAERLMHPKYNVEKIYQVSLDMNLRKEDFDKLLEGIELEDGYIKADDLSYVGDGDDHKEVGIVLHSGRNRIVRRVFEHLGYTVKHLDRVAYAGLTKKNVPKGKWRFLEPREVGFLKMKVGGDKQKGRSATEIGNKNAGRGKRGVPEKAAPVRKTRKPKDQEPDTED